MICGEDVSDTEGRSSDLLSQLARLVVDDPDFAKIDSKLDVFCPFEAMNMVRAEIRHSAFLATVIDPGGTHGFGDTCLRALLDLAIIGSAGTSASRLDLHLAELGNAYIRREWRSIDLIAVIAEARIVLAVEVKIDASEHGDQLSRYRKIVEETWPGEDWTRILVYLTLEGREASEDSWVPVSFADVLDHFERVLDQGNGIALARTMLRAYIDMARRRLMDQDDLTDVARRLWERHGAALEFLVENRPNPTLELMRALEDAAQDVSEDVRAQTGIAIVLDRCTNSYVRFAVPDWDQIPGMLDGSGWTPSRRLLLFECEGYREKFQMRLMLGKGVQSSREEIYERIIAASAAGIVAKGALAPQYQTLASKRIGIDLNKGEFPDHFERLKAGATSFIAGHVTQVDVALKSGLNPTN